MDSNLGAHIIFQKYFNRIFHRFVTPTLNSFSEYPVKSDPNQVIVELAGDNFLISSPNLKEEFNLLTQKLNDRYRSTNLDYPLNFATEIKTSYFLHSIVRVLKPASIIETGVANGHSSYFILNALLKNQSGTLYSFDVNNNVGKLINEGEKKNWNLTILPPRGRKKAFQDTIKRNGEVDIFIHDSNHFYYWQMFEYRTVWKSLKTGGLLLSDDVDLSYAFLDFCKRTLNKPIFISDSRKFFGILVKNL